MSKRENRESTEKRSPCEVHRLVPVMTDAGKVHRCSVCGEIVIIGGDV